MANWLLKTEPDTYSIDDLTRDQTTMWDGVSNATALTHLRAMKKGDRILIYHTGKEKAVVGTAGVSSGPVADPKLDDAKLVVVELKAGEKLKRAVPLSELRTDAAFRGWDLLRIGRLSVVPTSDAMWDRVLQLSRGN